MVAFEYGLAGFIGLFTILAFTTLGLLGISQIDTDINATPNLFDGISYFYQNPFTTVWSKMIWTILIITPMITISSMIALNYIRGRA